MKDYRVALEYLQGIVKSRIHIQDLPNLETSELQELRYDVAELLPSLAIDFDAHILYCAYPEPMHISFPHYVPSNWKAYDESKILERISELYRYWIINGIDHFDALGY